MRFRRRLSVKTDVNLIPMIDVVFQLVIYFMVSTTFIVTPGIPLLFPQSTTSEPVAMTKMVVTAVSEQEVYLNQTRYDLAGLAGAFAAISEEEKKNIKTIIIEGDARASYALMIRILDILRDNGFKGLNLKTLQTEESVDAITE
jgi:biopolymer transport protein ExbD